MKFDYKFSGKKPTDMRLIPENDKDVQLLSFLNSECEKERYWNLQQKADDYMQGKPLQMQIDYI
jgi:hypothetical protein